MNKYDKAVLAKLEQLCADGGLEYRHPDPNDSAAFNGALEYYTDAGRSDCATLLTGAVVPFKFDEAEKQVKAGSRLIETREKWVAGSASEFAEISESIGEKGRAQIRYVSPFAECEARYDVLLAAFEEKRPLDMRRGITQVGPHRDDLELTLDGRDLRLFGSAGQQRTTAFALKMLEAATLRDHAGAEPVLLLDDPFAELDIHRAAKILLMLEKRGLGQTILAVPRQADIPPGLMRLDRMKVRDGRITV